MKSAVRHPSERRPTLADAMILVAASAVGVAWTRIVAKEFGTVILGDEMSYLSRVERAFHLLRLLDPGLVVASVVAFVLRLRAPRPTRRRLARQPGAVACAVVAMLFGARFALYVPGRLLRPIFVPTGPDFAYSDWVILSHTGGTGWAIAAAWAVLIAGGRWSAERHWLDRSGRMLGMVWILVEIVRTTGSFAC